MMALAAPAQGTGPGGLRRWWPLACPWPCCVLIKGIRLSWSMASHIGRFPITRLNTPVYVILVHHRGIDVLVAMAVSGALELGLNKHLHTTASRAFQDQTAAGKLNAVIMPTIPSGCHCSYIRWDGLHCAWSIHTAGGSVHGKIRDIDHLLNFTFAFGGSFRSPGDQGAQDLLFLLRNFRSPGRSPGGAGISRNFSNAAWARLTTA